MEPRAGAPQDDEIFVLTAQGSAELRGAGTSLSPAELEILVLVDGRSSAAQVMRGAHGLSPEAAREALRKLLHSHCVEPAAKVHSDGIDAAGLFTPDAAHAALGSLQSSGYYVRIARRPHHAEHHAEEAKPPVLVIDDDPALGKMLRTYLTLEGYAPRIAANRAQIVDAFRHPPRPELVLLDVTLPDTDGFEVLATIRRHPALKTVPVIMLTAKSTREAVLKGIEGGADGYVTKPFEIEVLMKAVRSVLGRDAAGHAESDAAADQLDESDERADYLKRLLERLDRLEQLRRDLAFGTAPASSLPELQRELHTIAGSAAMFDLRAASQAAHAAEVFLEPHCRPGAAPGNEVWGRLRELLDALRRAAQP
jgi:two-component system, OmpR family, response regulator